MVFDENGMIYVAEMLDYPDDPPDGQPARSRILLLEDLNGDGAIDRTTVFAERLLQVSGILPWKGGLLAAAAPDILYLKDTDGDRRADLRRVLFTGFPKVNPEARITNLRLGIDNWVYAANSGSDGRITSPERPHLPTVLVRGTDFRFRPDGSAAEPASGAAQFGMTFDDWGNRFLTQNTIHLRHAVLPMHYLLRNPLLAPPSVSQDISDHGRPAVRVFTLSKPQRWREQRTRLRERRYRENRLEKTEQLGGFFTAATGGTVYNGDAFPQQYQGNIFTGDVNGNLVHRDILSPDGVTFSARRGEENAEFLASTDIWFRPVNFANAPDGNLYLLDMYREFIETPESIPEAIKKSMNFYSGDTMGRIYRITPKQPLRKGNLKPNLGAAGAAELVPQLASANGWRRQTAQRLLVERQDRTAIPWLQKLSAESEFPQARLHAWWALEGLAALTPEAVRRALGDPHPAIREHALRLAEAFLPASNIVAEAVLARSRDPEPRVQFQLAFTLGQWRHPRSLAALAEIASARGGDPWFRAAILSSASDSAFPLFQILLSRGGRWGSAPFLTGLTALIGAKQDRGEMTQVLNARFENEFGAAAVAGLAQGLRLAGASAIALPAVERVLLKHLESPSEAMRNAAAQLAQHIQLRAWIEKAMRDAATPSLPAANRIIALRALRGGQLASVGPVLGRLLQPGESLEVQLAAVESLASFDDPGISALLLANWKSYTPEVRKKSLEALLAHRQRASHLLAAVEKGEVEPAALEAGARDRLRQHPDAAIRQRAERLFQGEITARAKVVQLYQPVVGMAGEAGRGKQAFDNHCVKCHQPRRAGGRVGPDLSGINNKSRHALLTAILNPSAEIEPRYVNYVLVTRSGRLHDGVIVNETPSALTLRSDTEEADLTILRNNIAEIRASSVSLMPDELEKQMSRQDLADLISYLRGGL